MTMFLLLLLLLVLRQLKLKISIEIFQRFFREVEKRCTGEMSRKRETERERDYSFIQDLYRPLE